MNSSLLLSKHHLTSATLPQRMPPPPRLPAHRLNGGSWASAILPLRSTIEIHYLRLSDPAARVMTDFAQQEALTVEEDRPIEDALDDMFRFGVRALLTVRGGNLTGLVTSYDIQGERTQQLIDSRHDLKREDIRVADILTALADLPTVGWETVQQSSVGDLLEVLDGIQCTHLLVLEKAAGGSMLLRGLISHTRLQRQLERLI